MNKQPRIKFNGQLFNHPAHRAVYEVCQQIEMCGASEELTKAVTMCGELQDWIATLTTPTNENPTPVRAALLPCPFCGESKVNIIEGDTFRWRVASCASCEARASSVRIKTFGDGTLEEWAAQAELDAIKEWNTRAALAQPEHKCYKENH